MPLPGQYVLTNVQSERRSVTAQDGSPEPITTGTAEATEAATGEATTEATLEATAETTAEVTAEATATAEATQAPTAEATGEPTAEPAAEATPDASEVVGEPGSRNNPLSNPCTGQPFETVMTGAGLRDAAARIGGQAQNEYVVAFQLNSGSEDATAFTNFTAANINQPLAIVLDGEVLSSPVVESRIEDSGEITGGFTQDEARNLSLQLRSGALPVSLSIQSIERVGASLGAESVALSVRAGILGVVTIFLFLLVYYRVGGLAASLALLVFTAINFALYKFIPVTLTLSAITGFLISIGSAIDGNILIFERIKEELRNGRGLSKAVDVGFSRAWRTIRDSNISTILIGLILYFFGGQFGASAVRGFAVTLIIGLTLNLFTSVVVTRVFLEVILRLLGDGTQRLNLFGQQAQ
jgi:protein-export membrane protein SecD